MSGEMVKSRGPRRLCGGGDSAEKGLAIPPYASRERARRVCENIERVADRPGEDEGSQKFGYH